LQELNLGFSAFLATALSFLKRRLQMNNSKINILTIATTFIVLSSLILNFVYPLDSSITGFAVLNTSSQESSLIQQIQENNQQQLQESQEISQQQNQEKTQIPVSQPVSSGSGHSSQIPSNDNKIQEITEEDKEPKRAYGRGNNNREIDGPYIPPRLRFAFKNLRQGFALWREGRMIENRELFEGKSRFSLYKSDFIISDFDIDFRKEIDFSKLIANTSTEKRKAFIYSDSELIENIHLYIPRNQNDTQVIICVNASSFEQIYEGCSELPEITEEYVLKIGDENLEISEDGLFFIVKEGITGAGV
jgi:K+-transporting ATPase c subunit